MADGFNRVMLLGNLGADPELRFTQGGQAVLNLRLATTESYLDRDKVRRERTDWHNVVIWGKRGEALAKILAKGSSIFVEGAIRTSSYEDRDGNKRYKTEIAASNLVLAGRGRSSSAGDDMGGPPADFGGGGDFGSDTPNSGGRTHTQSAPRGGGGHGRGGGGNAGAGNGRSNGGRQAPPPQDPGPPADDFGYDGGDDIPF